MVFVNGQKFACATCIKGHRSTTCNHGERPLHEIKKKGRPATQCQHCKELRKAKQVHVKCICGREDATSAMVNGVQRTKSLSHDGRPFDIGDAMSAEGTGSTDISSPAAGYSCGCLEGKVCTCCRDRGGHIVVKPGKSTSPSTVFKTFQVKHQRSATSLDLGKPGLLILPRDSSSPKAIALYAQSAQPAQSPDGSISSSSSVGVGSPFIGMTQGEASTYAQLMPSLPVTGGLTYGPGSSTSNPQLQMQSHLCFDYASSSDYDSDQYSTPSTYSYYPQTLPDYAMSNASDELVDADTLRIVSLSSHSSSIHPTASADDVGSLYTALSNFSTDSPSLPPQLTTAFPTANGSCSASQQQFPTSTPSTSKSCCRPSNATDSPTPTAPPQSTSAGRSDAGQEGADMSGCGCAVSASMCCCGEMCACPGCLAYPNNHASYVSGFASQSPVVNVVAPESSAANTQLNRNAQGGSCCGSKMAKAAMDGHSNASGGASGHQAINLSKALSLIGQYGMEYDARQAVMGFPGAEVEAARMQHPTLLSETGVLICGCGCGRPTVDCADCFQDMCKFVGESQARVLKDELELEMALNRDGHYLADIGLSMDLGMDTSMGAGMSADDMGMDLSLTNAQTGLVNQSVLPEGFGNGHSQVEQLSLNLQQTTMRQDHQQQAHQLSTFQSHLRNQQVQQHVQGQGSAQGSSQSLNGASEGQIQGILEEQRRLRLQMMEQEQMQLSQLHQAMPTLSQLQLDFLDDEDWSFVDEIKTDPPMPIVQK
ncbi:hypothetical protein BGW38_010113 [Lunasporangiospora selenospora]|uniref:Copper-fist domain-containing protein n=1 Tax=Lunasporangiospora selenospora TaxID=979761 RepID=A0A9P6G202_9FUNG|nr:hypothetical protein BGW38_010113 [Lunasporangiospora selenospora]